MISPCFFFSFSLRNKAWKHTTAVQRGIALLDFSQNTGTQAAHSIICCTGVIVRLLSVGASDVICVNTLHNQPTTL